MYQIKETYQKPAITLYRVKSEGGMMAGTNGGSSGAKPSTYLLDEPAITEFPAEAKQGGTWD